MRFLGSVFLGLICLVPTISYALTIDDFVVDQSVEATGPGNSAANSILDAGALGGARTMATNVISGNAASKVRLTTDTGIASHSQEASAVGLSLMMWDGDTTNSLNSIGLGGVDLTQDGSTAFILDVLEFDLPSGNPVDITLEVYDASDITATKYSFLKRTLNSAISSSTPVEFQYAGFSAGPGGAAAFSNVGAIRLIVNGAFPAIDLTFDTLRTNGDCDEIPVAEQSVYDECGVCGGDNSSCAGCDGVPNSGLVFDSCGVCDGNNSSCSGCDGVPNSELVFDACGVCGGSNSCAGCDGIPNSGKVLDQCNVCDGDGTSCNPCVENDQEEILAEMDNGAKVMERIIDKMHVRLLKLNPTEANVKYVEKSEPIVHELQNRNWILSWTLPVVSVLCESTELCVAVSTLPILDEYREHNKELLNYGKKAIKKTKSALGGTLSRIDQKQLNKLTRQYEANEKLADLIPTSQSVCS